MKNIYILLIMMLLSSRMVIAQHKIPVKISFLAEQISLPTFENYGGNWGYGFSIGSEYKYRKKIKTELAQTADFYFFAHDQYGASYILASLFNFRYKPGKFNIDLKAGPGYMLFHHYTPVYKKVNDQYEKSSNLQSKFSVLASIGVSYNVQHFKPFVSYNLLAETPFINSSSSFLTHQIVEIGFYYTLNIQKNEN